MGAIADVLDKARARRSIASDNALSARVGVSRQTISQWRSGTTYPDAERIAQIAELAGYDAEVVLVLVMAEREEGRAGQAWQRLAKRLTNGAALAGVAVASAAAWAESAAVRIINRPCAWMVRTPAYM